MFSKQQNNFKQNDGKAHITHEILAVSYQSHGRVVWKACPMFTMDRDVLLPVTVKWEA